MKYIKAIKPGNNNDLLTQTYDQIKEEMIPVPPLVVQSVLPEMFAASWHMYRELYLVKGCVKREVKEAVNTAISMKNTCPFCVNVHSTVLSGLEKKHLTTALLQNDLNLIKDTDTRKIIEWAMATYNFGHNLHKTPPFNKKEAPEIMGTALQFHYTNRIVNVFIEGQFFPPSGKNFFIWVIGKVMSLKGLVGKYYEAGKSSELLCDYPDVEQLEWAKLNPQIYKGLINQYWTVENAVCDIIKDDVKKLFYYELDMWDGLVKGMSTKWVDVSVRGLSNKEKSVARLVLLTAFASYQIDEDTVKSFRQFFPEERDLFAVVAWSAFMTSCLIVNKTTLY